MGQRGGGLLEVQCQERRPNAKGSRNGSAHRAASTAFACSLRDFKTHCYRPKHLAEVCNRLKQRATACGTTSRACGYMHALPYGSALCKSAPASAQSPI